ncbi:PBP1A family penicillin-binding protein [Roseomonas sp. NAR14]|uniref:PBP1A family penicillin-binding protein n=1 Tax=Roseomonas acroporae TaxID=2937791 RepID=A0A9X1Y7L2_9PROT|nr:PBP1A family penicillin-binding protein [Roseomonas acroporae]MCK8784613.1 PBP1A family penicillin-binding protein [Roseomonas acroporae]
MNRADAARARSREATGRSRSRKTAPAARRAGAAPPPRPAGRPPRHWSLRLLGLLVVIGIWGMVALAVVLLWFAHDLPRPEAALAATRRPSVTLLAADGRMLATFGDLYGDPVHLRDLPPYVPAALLSVEDRRFRAHPGVDPIGLLRAAWANFRAGRVVQGGSTLTQQLAKNLFLSPERNLRRKVQEAILALWLEWRFSKDELLEIYLNRVYLGAGAYGVDAAARLYFGVPARRLSLWQAAMLAGLPKAPSRLNPRASPDAALDRTFTVLQAMVANGALTARQAADESDRIRLPPPPSREAGWFADWVQEDLPELTAAGRLPGDADLVLRTTLDSRLQAAVESRLATLLAGPGARAGVTQGAVVAIDAGSGAVRAMAGGRDYRSSPFNRATEALRQPGSAFKPFAYLAALEHGQRPDSTVADTPLTIGNWSPGNGAWRARGEVTLEDALAYSVNTAAVRVMNDAGGWRAATAAAGRLGLSGRWPRDASLALGTGEVTPLALTAAYAAFANGGMRVTPYGLAEARIGGQGGGQGGSRAVALPHAMPERAVAPEHAGAMRRMLEAVVARGTGRAAALPGGQLFGRPVGGKTGTTQEFRDAWFVGFIDGAGSADPLVLGVWLGNDDATPMDGVAGGTLPARLFREILEAAGPGRR